MAQAQLSSGQQWGTTRGIINANASDAETRLGAIETRIITPPVNMSTINAAIAALENTGGAIQIKEGVVTLDESGVLRNGVSIYPTPPAVTFNRNCPDLGFQVEGGTVFQGTGAETVWEAGKIAGGPVTVSGSTFTKTGHGYENGLKVWFSSDGAVPSPLIAETQNYFVVNATINTFQVSATDGGAAITLTDAGSGAIIVHPADGVSTTVGSFGAKNVKHVYDVGAEYGIGMAFATIYPFVVESCEDWVADMGMCQHVTMYQPQGFDVVRGVRFWTHCDACSPGISTVNDGFLNLRALFAGADDYARRWGYVQENRLVGGLQIDNVRFNDCQVNAYGGGKSLTVDSVDVGANSITFTAAHERSIGEPIRFYGDDLPAPLEDNVAYLVKSVIDTTTITVSSADDDVLVDITDVGSGTQSSRCYPGDTLGFVSVGADSSAVSSGMTVHNGMSDGVVNMDVYAKDSNAPILSMSSTAASVHGDANIVLRGTKKAFVKTNIEDTVVDADATSTPFFLTGIVTDVVDQLPSSIYADTATNDIFYPLTNKRALRASHADGYIAPVIASNNTWPHIGMMPVYPLERTGGLSIGKDRVGGHIFNNASAATATLPSVATVAPGAVIIIHAKGSADVTVTPGGTDTINGATGSKTLTSGNVLTLIADNIGGRINWIGSVAAQF